MTPLARATTIVNDRPIVSSERISHKDYDRKGSVAKKTLFVNVKGPGAKTNGNSDSDSESTVRDRQM
jgi:hypothetical protein